MKPQSTTIPTVKPVNTCSLQNAKEATIGNSKYCLAKISTSTYTQAKTICRALNSKLPVPRNNQETTDLVAALNTLSITPSEATPVILGISDSSKGHQKGIWYDYDDQKLNYTNWAPGQPNNGYGYAQDYAAINRPNGKWGDYQNDPKSSANWASGVVVCLQELVTSGKSV